MLALNQSAGLEQSLQNHLAPVTLHLAVALERPRQVIGLLREAVVQRHQLLDMLSQREALFGFRSVGLLHLLLELLNRSGQGLEQLLQMVGIQLTKLLRTALKNPVREVLKGHGHGLLQRLLLLLLLRVPLLHLLKLPLIARLSLGELFLRTRLGLLKLTLRTHLGLTEQTLVTLLSLSNLPIEQFYLALCSSQQGLVIHGLLTALQQLRGGLSLSDKPPYKHSAEQSCG